MADARPYIPTATQLAEDDLVHDVAHGRDYCPVHPQQQMIPTGFRSVCPLDHGDEPAGRYW